TSPHTHTLLPDLHTHTHTRTHSCLTSPHTHTHTHTHRRPTPPKTHTHTHTHTHHLPPRLHLVCPEHSNHVAVVRAGTAAVIEVVQREGWEGVRLEGVPPQTPLPCLRQHRTLD